MKNDLSKSQLAIFLSTLEGFSEPKVRLEQYAIDSEICADMLHKASFLGDLRQKVIVDLGCGTGIIGIGALLMDARKAIFMDTDKDALKIAKKNISKAKSETSFNGEVSFIERNIESIDKDIKADVVYQNPPYGTKIKHNDMLFLKKAFEIAPVVYSIHKSETIPYIRDFSLKHKRAVTHIWDYEFPIKSTMKFHKKGIHRIKVSCIRLIGKIGNK